jgi:hypothetical protein
MNTKEKNWEWEFHWKRVTHTLKERMNLPRVPDLNGVLFLIGLQELGRWEMAFTKEQKQDLMHIAICRLLETDGYYEFIGRDADGWPHYKRLKPVPKTDTDTQEDLLKQKAMQYFEEWEKPVDIAAP